MATAREVAAWMLKKLEEDEHLYQESIVFEIAARFGEEFTYTNDSGGQSISRSALSEFGKLTEGSVVWERQERMWRKREDWDGPQRQQP